MKKINALLVSACAIGLIASNSWAGTLHLTADQNSAVAAAAVTTDVLPGYYPVEAVVGGDDVINFNTAAVTASMPSAVVATSAALRTITYVPTTDLPSGTRIQMTLNGAAWTNTKLYLLSDATAIDFDGITVATTDSITAGVANFVVGSTPVNAGDVLVLSGDAQDASDDGARDGANPSIKLNATLSTVGNVTLTVSACYDAIGDIIGGLAPAITIFGTYQQFVFTVSGGSATINVEDPDFRTTFLSSSLLSTGNVVLVDHQADADLFTSLTGNQVSFFAVDLDTAALATIDYAVSGLQLNKLTSLVLDMDSGGLNDKAFTIASDSSATLSIATDDDTNWYDNATEEDLNFTVDGTSTLDTQVFAIAGTLNFADGTSYNDVSQNAATVMTWGINGAQFMVPHLISRDTWESYLVIKTAVEANAGDIFVDMMRRDGTVKKLTKDDLAALDLESGANGGSVYITAKQLLTAAGWATGTMDNDFSAKIIITLPQSQVFIDGFKYANGSTYPISVYEYKGWGIDNGNNNSYQYVK